MDNPDVPNMTEVGLQPWYQGHGLRFLIGDVFFLAEAIDVSGLPRGVFHDPRSDIHLFRVPAAAVIDVLSTYKDDALWEQRFPDCGAHVHRSFDRLEGGFIKHGRDIEYSVQRPVLTHVNGRAILQDTNTSAVDLIRARYTPGRLP